MINFSGKNITHNADDDLPFYQDDRYYANAYYGIESPHDIPELVQFDSKTGFITSVALLPYCPGENSTVNLRPHYAVVYASDTDQLLVMQDCAAHATLFVFNPTENGLFELHANYTYGVEPADLDGSRSGGYIFMQSSPNQIKSPTVVYTNGYLCFLLRVSRKYDYG